MCPHSAFSIYIPVWIDLKRENYSPDESINNLHSSMDRFEDFAYFELDLEIRHLHSSMDRFEAEERQLKIESEMYLHSSMDRFEELTAQEEILIDWDLHSSMDRFEVDLMCCLRSKFGNIYIPVWIDLKITLPSK